jgi:starch synthase
MTPSGGAQMDGLLRHRSWDVHGILNGIDTDVWDPETDERIPVHFGLETLEKRVENKRALQDFAGLPVNDDVPLFGVVSRLDYQKGFDILGHALYLLLLGYAGDAQFVVLGTGADEYEQMFTGMARNFPEKMTAVLEYNAGLAPLIYAGSDAFLMPSRFEPCGLGQLIAMRYGCVPVVRATGGLVDTVADGVTGFTFGDMSEDALWQAMQRATYVHNIDPARWLSMQRTGMSQDFSWERSARSYEHLYEWALAK